MVAAVSMWRGNYHDTVLDLPFPGGPRLARPAFLRGPGDTTPHGRPPDFAPGTPPPVGLHFFNAPHPLCHMRGRHQMRSVLLATLLMALLVVLSTEAIAGKIFGDVSIDGKPVAAGIKLRITHPGATATADTAVTDKFGSYKLMVKEEGKSVLTIVYEKTALGLPVFSNKEATRYDLVVEKKDGKLSLRRK